MKKDHNDEVLLKQVKTTLETAANDLDPALVTRLRGMRRAAISQAGSRQFLRAWQWGGAVAATLLVVVFTLNSLNDTLENRVIENMAGLDDLQMLSATEDLELYKDLEFYSWLDEIQKTG